MKHFRVQPDLRPKLSIQLCVQHPELIIKAPPTVGRLGGFIWKFQKNFGGKTLQIVAEVYKNRCYPITGYWLGE